MVIALSSVTLYLNVQIHKYIHRQIDKFFAYFAASKTQQAEAVIF